MKKIAISVSWQIPGQAPLPCRVELYQFDGVEQLWRAIKTGGLFLLLAALTVPIPIVHIFAPPVFLLLALVMIARSLSLHEMAVTASGVCGNCQQCICAQLGNVKPVYPLWTLCPACHERLRVLAPTPPALNNTT